MNWNRRNAAVVAFVALLVAPVLTAQENSLSADERQAGFRLLFDGETVDGWQPGPPKKNAEGRWLVLDGELTVVGKPADLMTVEEFSDFEIVFDWKLGKLGNSGILYRAPNDNAVRLSVEYQLADNQRPASQQYADRLCGAAYGLYPPVVDATKPMGEWNTSRIVARGPHVEHWLNGQKIVEYEVGSADWNERLAKSKFAKNTGFGAAPRGRLIIQHHGDPLWFRNIKVRPLAP